MKAIAAAFDLRGNMISAEPYGSGHINDTYKVVVDQGGLEVNYILQRVNQNVFPNVEKLMENIQRVTAHLGKKIIERGGNPTRETLTLVPTVDGKSYYRDAEGGCWRAYIFIYGARTYDFVSDTKQAFEAASAFGSFQKQLADLPGGPVFESIPNFHNTPKRFENFLNSLKADKLNRAASAKKEIEFALARQDKISDVMNGLANGTIPLRATHNDTKINNVLLDDATGEGICVIDLDTLMPGSALYDFGDMVRSATLNMAEDSKDYKNVVCRRDIFEALARGFVEAGDFLNEAELGNMTFGGLLMTLECGVRFLTDYLDGDHYFKIHRPEHNLDRCRTQFALVKSIQDEYDELQGFVNGLRR